MSIVLLSPLTGWVADLDEAPDEVFAGRVLGDGVAIDPTEGVLKAPCDGEVITVAATGHAIAVRGSSGVEVLMHVGIDSVALRGDGFQAQVAVGQSVKAGEPLLCFDLDRVARGARSLVTPVLVTNGDRFEIVRRAGGLTRVGEVLMELRERIGGGATSSGADHASGASTRFVTRLSEGVHARPAARIVTAARAAGVEVTVGAHGRTASAYSALGLMGLGIRNGDEIALWSDDPRAPAAFAGLRKAFQATADIGASAEPVEAPLEGGVLLGIRGSPGMAIGMSFRYAATEPTAPIESAGAPAERRALDAALAAVRRSLEHFAETSSGARGDVLRAHAVLLDDPVLREAALSAIDGGASAGTAWRSALRRQADLFGGGGDRRLRERRADLLDLERQVLTQLYGSSAEPPKPPPGAIVLADELLPSELAGLADLSIAGVAMAGGGATSHVAIMAAALGLPMLTAVRGLERAPAETLVILDADSGRLIVSPDPSAVAEMQARRDRRSHQRAVAAASAREPCVTADGVRIAVFANLGGLDEAERAVAAGAEGCGLLRSEFLFQDRSSPPDEDEQHAAYQAVADGLAGRPLTIRTLDIGADKPASYLALPAEENPALGLRGVRVSLWRPELLRIQLRAILRVQGEVLILVPMVASRHEIAAVRAQLLKEAAAMAVSPPPLGVMIETPAAALTVAGLAEEAAFFSLGANDLTQYALAMDRTLPMLADQLDGLHPAVVTLMRMAAEAAVMRGCRVSVCGALASDPVAIPLLIGLGVTELSMPPGDIAEAKALIRTLSAADCRAFAGAANADPDARATRRAVLDRWPQTGDAG